MKFGNYYGIHFSSVVIEISMKLFDQLVIVICDPDLKGYAPSGKLIIVVHVVLGKKIGVI